MPYFVFAVAAGQRPEPLSCSETYREAKASLVALREAAERSDAVPDGAFVRMVFAPDEAAAADLLTRIREPDPALDAED
jgi:hypothetical protein